MLWESEIYNHFVNQLIIKAISCEIPETYLPQVIPLGLINGVYHSYGYTQDGQSGDKPP